MVVATLALVLSTAGTAAAAVLVSSPDQLADEVVTNPKLDTDSVDGRVLAFRSVNSSQIVERAVGTTDLTNPVFSAAVGVDGTTTVGTSVGVNPSQTRKIGSAFIQRGMYTVGFRQDVSACAITATARTRGVTANVNPSGSSVAVQLTRPPILSAGETVPAGVDAAFDVVAQC